mmetsp:Transcript_59517/g.191519  ORF Transcript_59517/g.191519 Transcript_59517/m.191519 type:complete len:211 (-) Transcript_59517:191-823(-)
MGVPALNALPTTIQRMKPQTGAAKMECLSAVLNSAAMEASATVSGPPGAMRTLPEDRRNCFSCARTASMQRMLAAWISTKAVERSLETYMEAGTPGMGLLELDHSRSPQCGFCVTRPSMTLSTAFRYLLKSGFVEMSQPSHQKTMASCDGSDVDGKPWSSSPLSMGRKTRPSFARMSDQVQYPEMMSSTTMELRTLSGLCTTCQLMGAAS